jgi:hypothetical protein
MKQYGYSLENSVSPETVAASMVDLVTNGQYGGGSCMEVATNESRLLGTWNIPASSGNGSTIDLSALEENYKPILAKLQAEREAL